MEDFIIKLQHEVKNDPLTTLNVVMAVFTVVSFTRLCSDIVSSLCCKKTPYNKTDIVLSLINTTEKVESLENEISNLQSTIDRMDNYLTQIHFQLCVNTKSDNAEGEQEEQSQDQSQTDSESQTEEQQEQEQTPVNSPTPSNSVVEHQELEPVKAQSPKDKHAQLIDVLKNGDTVSMTYKKQTFTATFKIKTGSQHGYVLKSGDTEYNTPSHFSHAKKVSINDKIKSDNGWDTVYVVKDNKKVCLNDLLSV
jgi:TolA-binding protein